MRLVLATLLLAACYAPNTPGNVPCGKGEACPSGQRCVAGVCTTDGTPDIDAPVSTMIDAPVIDAPAGDAPQSACAGGNGQCLVACVGTDPDCTTTCGDNVCVGNAGEMCKACASDCNKTAIVCGNGQCQMGESPDCFADCGPTPWTWTTQEQALVTRINNARTNGFACPGSNTVTRPALAVDTTMQAASREWAWEIGHMDFYMADASSCNGRTLADRKATGGNFTSYVLGVGYGTADEAFDAWMASASLCSVVMSPNVTKLHAAVALDATKAYLVVMK